MDEIGFKNKKDLKRRWSALSIMQRVSKRKRSLFWPPEREESLALSHYSFFPSKDVIKHKEKQDRLVFNPTSLLRVVWDTIISAQAVYLAITIPFSLSFWQKIDKNLIIPFEICFMIDFLLNFNTACYIHGVLVADRKRIFIHYLSTYFLWDFLSVVPYEWFLNDMEPDSGERFRFDYWHWPRLFWLMRLTRMTKLRRLIYNVEDNYPNPLIYFITRTLIFLLLAFLSCHWIACIMHTAWYYSLSYNGDMWQSYIEGIREQYLAKLEQVVVTMLTVGYGNMTPKSIPEKIVTIIIEGCASGFLGYLVGGIISTIRYSAKDSIYFVGLKRKMNIYLHKHHIPQPLGRKIMAYIDHLYQYQKQNILDEQEILSSLSQPMQREIYIKTRGDLLIKSAPFRDYSYKFLKYLGQKLEVELFSPSDLIFKQGEKNDAIYLVRQGSVEIFHHSTGTVYTEIREGKYFGEISFFLGRKRCASARSAEFSELFSLNREFFQKMLLKLPKEQELTNIIVNNCKGKDLSYLGVRCYYCLKMGHVVEECNEIVYKTDHDSVIKRANFLKNAGKRISRKDIDSERRREVVVLRRHSLQNIHGGEIDPMEQYQNRKTLIAKVKGYDIRKICKGRSRETMITVLKDDKEDTEEKNYYPNIPNYLQFSKNYTTKHKNRTLESPLKGSLIHLSAEYFSGDEHDRKKKKISDGNETMNSSLEI
ncbi:unnamed protein product [Blepharisma stoltei]|uniref:Cyclic nucleotide-binding domain-containing protein n=1 Tax=Blepharisma stoltei TaxID=1481888 RepID=A0AAU9JKY1_9CILI|nr:unnamed protein product [Blepharisma stoltei]